jgi:hypothetical protein
MKTTLYLAKEPDAGVRNDLSHLSGEVTIVDCLGAYGDYYRKIGYNVISKEEFFKFKNMKFDVVVGNPPFQDGSKDTSYNQLWAEFFVKSFSLLKDNGRQLLIHPITWATPKDGSRKCITNEVVDILREHATFINYKECTKHFPKVGSTFSFTIVTKTKNTGSMKVVTDVDEFTVDRPSSFIDNVLSKNNNKIAISIVNKIRSYDKRDIITRDKTLVGELSATKDKTHIYRVQYAATTEKWSNECHPLQGMKKVLFANQSSKNYPVYDDGISAPCNRGAIYQVSSAEEGNNIVETMKTDVMNFFFSHLRFHHGLLNTNVINSIPNLDYSKVWNNEELANEFGLTEEEQNYITRQ